MARQEKDNSKFNLIVEGTGLKTVMITEGVDYTKTVTNHLMEIENVLGIEAARSTIIKEIQATMADHGIAQDCRHLYLLADAMTS